MASPLVQLIVWMTIQIYDTVMKIFPRTLIEVPGAQQRYDRTESDFHRIANNANTTSHRIAQTLTTSYVHAPLCPLPAELPFLVPKLTWECLAMIYRQVRMMEAERQIVEDLALTDAGNIMDAGPVCRELRQEAEQADDDYLMVHELDNIRERQLDNIMAGEADNIIAGEADNIIAGEADNIIAGEADNIIGVEADNIMLEEAGLFIVLHVMRFQELNEIAQNENGIFVHDIDDIMDQDVVYGLGRGI